MDAADITESVERLLAQPVLEVRRVQDLWSGYGAIFRMKLGGNGPDSVVVKAVAPPDRATHPRGWNSDASHERKLRSYEVERQWYRKYGDDCGEACRIPELYVESNYGGAWLFVFEDLDASGFSARRSEASPGELRACLEWLASMHATFLGKKPQHLWRVGTYWHLDTRPDELAAMKDPELREAAPLLDARLNACAHQTFVHGDAKIANFCFPPEGGAVAAVDFQYVGGGCGIKDVAYLFSSCLDDEQLEASADAYLEEYFAALRARLGLRLSSDEIGALEAEWRELYPFAWADFVRFLAGWSPGHWKLGRYSERLTAQALAAL